MPRMPITVATVSCNTKQHRSAYGFEARCMSHPGVTTSANSTHAVVPQRNRHWQLLEWPLIMSAMDDMSRAPCRRRTTLSQRLDTRLGYCRCTQL
jgi:hypothetical protein